MDDVAPSPKAPKTPAELPRVCYLLESFHPERGGMEEQGRLVVQHFLSRGMEVEVVTRRTSRELAASVELWGASIERIPPTGPGGGKRWLMTVTAAWWLWRMRHRYDVIFVSGFRVLGVPAVLVAKLLGKSVLLKPDNPGELSGAFFNGRLEKFRLRHDHPLVKHLISLRNLLLKRADLFCPISEATRDEFDAAGVPSVRMEFVPNSYDPERFYPVSSQRRDQLRSRFEVAADDVVAVFTGRLVSWKGPQVLVRIWGEMADEPGWPILFLVGSDGKEMFNVGPEIRSAVAQNNFSGRVKVTGWADNVEDYLAIADFYVFPSQGGEGLPTSVIEAMAMGLPIVSTRTPGIYDLVTEDVGILVDPGDETGLNRAITRLAADAGLRKRLGCRAASVAKRRYSSSVTGDRYLDLIEALS